MDLGLHYAHLERMAEPRCAIIGCDEPAAHTCVCCNRQVCHTHIDMADGWPSLCPDCLMECQFTLACQVVQQPAPVTCHRCGAVVDGDALAVQTAADGGPRLNHWYCRAHLVAGTERLKAAIRAQREGGE